MLADAKVLTVSELSDYLRVHRSTIYRLLKKGQLPGFKIGSDCASTWRRSTNGGSIRVPRRSKSCATPIEAQVGHARDLV